MQAATGLVLLLGACGSDDVPAHLPGSDPPPPSSTSTTDAGSDSTSADATTSGSMPDLPPDAGPGRTPPPGPPFEDVTEALGIVAPHEVILGQLVAGVSWGDIDGDGWLDLFVAGGVGPSTLLHNEGDGTLSVSPWSAVVGAIPSVVSASFVDVDDDGWQDLYVLCKGPNVLLHNDGGRGLVDVTDVVGLGDDKPAATASWADWDADGDLDLFVANTGLHPDGLYRNDQGRFTDVRAFIGGGGVTQTFVGGFVDYDNDRDLDLYVVVDKYAGNQLWRNDGPGCGGWCFRNVAGPLGADTRLDGMGIAVGDVDNDGDLDLAFSDFGGQALLYNRIEQGTPGFRLALHEEAGLGLHTTQPSWGLVLMDYDGDGWLDLYAGVSGYLGDLVGNPLYRNRGDGTFQDVSVGSGANLYSESFGVAVADYDRDGDLDIAVGNRDEGLHLLRNRTRDDGSWHYTNVELRGAGPGGRHAVGARVWIETSGGRTLVREVMMGASQGAGHSPRLHFGLGTDTIVGATVRWADGTVETMDEPVLDGHWTHVHPDAVD